MVAEELPTVAQQWILKSKASGKLIPEEHLELQMVPLFPEGTSTEGKVLIKTTHIQFDPSNLVWISSSPAVNGDRCYVPQTPVGAPITGGVVAEVVASWHPEFSIGQIVSGYLNWSTYHLIDVEFMRSIGAPLFSIPPGIEGADFMCLLGSVAGYVGLFKTTQVTVKTCKTIVVSAGAGTVGSAVIQIAKKVLGIERVIAIVGSEEKCKFCVEELGADLALNYNAPDYAAQFIAATPEYVDVYFDNVAGETLALAGQRIALNGRIIACGGISGYQNETDPQALPLSAYMAIVYQNASILGMIVTQYVKDFEAILAEMFGWVATGKFQPFKTVVNATIEEIPQGIEMMFAGENRGKLIMKLAG